MSVPAYIGLGGNLGDPQAQMAQALRLLDASDRVRVEAVSPLYRTPPWGKTDQPDFLNSCARLRTDLDAEALLALCLVVENQLHRQRAERWGPRTIDIDLLVFGSSRIDTPGLAVPHPRLTERAFVLRPLADLDGDMPVLGRTVREWLADVDAGGIRLHRPGGDWWRGTGDQ